MVYRRAPAYSRLKIVRSAVKMESLYRQDAWQYFFLCDTIGTFDLQAAVFRVTQVSGFPKGFIFRSSSSSSRKDIMNFAIGDELMGRGLFAVVHYPYPPHKHFTSTMTMRGLTSSMIFAALLALAAMPTTDATVVRAPARPATHAPAAANTQRLRGVAGRVARHILAMAVGRPDAARRRSDASTSRPRAAWETKPRRTP